VTAVRIDAVDFTTRAVAMRLPFRFGSVTMRSATEAHCTVTAVIDGRAVEGRSAQLMVPRWFDKRAEMSGEDTVAELEDSVRTACAAAPGMTGPAIAITRDLRAEVEARMAAGTPRLAAGFGPAFVEMALIDAICRSADVPFWTAARGDLFGLAADAPRDLSRERILATLARIGPPQSVKLRHTVGFDSPLTDGELDGDGPDDGLPVSLASAIEAYGFTAFKIKLKGDPDADIARLAAIAPVIAARPELSVTLDANEQYGSSDAFLAFLGALSRSEAVSPIREALRFVEQPFDRAAALAGPLPAGISVPLVIDESDDHEAAFAEALRLGWSGTSIKSCKGVLRALLNRARADASGAILSGEDLTCQPGLCWQQDTSMAAACGVQDLERNGHHFAGGMQGAPDTEIADRMVAHPDIYRSVNGRPALRIEGGEVAIGSLDRPGFGGT